MLYLASNLFNQESSDILRKRLILSDDWVDGTVSAKDSTIKRNLQLNHCEEKTKITKEIIEAIKNNLVINNFSFPDKIFNILFTRTGQGMYYGPHVDSPFISDCRRDLSFTIFLNKPEEYKGGELILYIPPEKKKVKLNQGDIIMYPTKYLHEVTKVTDGERMVCVGWIKSLIERDDERENLYIMKTAILEILEKHGNSSAIQNLNLIFNSLYKRSAK